MVPRPKPTAAQPFAAAAAAAAAALMATLLFTAPARAAPATRPSSLPPLRVPDALGVNIHFTDPRPAEMQMLAGAGFKFVRMDFTWGGTERRAGAYDFTPYDRLLDALRPHAIRAVFILDYANRLYDEGQAPHTDEGRAAMARWAAAAVTHFKGRGVVWEMWNEPNIAQFWKPKPSAEDYAKLAVEVGKAIRDAAPDELYVGPATSLIDMPFLETCFKAGCLAYWDAVSVHPYRQKAPETVGEEYKKLRALIDRHAPAGRQIPILSGEWGYSAPWKGYDVERQGKYLPRQWLTNLSNGVPLSIWYDWHDDGPDPKEAEHHFGTVAFPYLEGKSPVYEAKPAYLAARMLTKELAGLRYRKRLELGSPDDYCLLFASESGDKAALAVWSAARDGGGREVTIPASPGAFRVTDYLGRESRTVDAGDHGLTVTLTDAPQYAVALRPNALLATPADQPRRGERE